MNTCVLVSIVGFLSLVLSRSKMVWSSLFVYEMIVRNIIENFWSRTNSGADQILQQTSRLRSE
ncbi:hypothetical protein WDU94_001614, partial [Cyamophila willieti]